MIFVTSFSKEGFFKYGKQFIEGFIKHFPNNHYLHVFVDEDPYNLPIREIFKNCTGQNKISFYNLSEDKELVRFLKENSHIPLRNGIIQKDNDVRVDYRFQATKFAKKIFALTSKYYLPKNGWRIWIDADVVIKKDIPTNFFRNNFSNTDYLAYYIGRTKEWHHSECGFVVYNLDNGGKEFLEEFRRLYTQNLLWHEKEWHDSYLFDVLRKQYEEKGYKFYNIAKDCDVFHPWPKTILGEYMDHIKGPIAKKELEVNQAQQATLEDLMLSCKNRYGQLTKLIELYKPKTIVEVGVFKGERTVLMLKEALKHSDTITYFGFDLFEDMTNEISEMELNTKGMPATAEYLNNFIAEELKEFSDTGKTLNISFVKGNTRDTLSNFSFNTVIDFAFIDGGHSIQTIKNDFEALSKITKNIVLDDYYLGGVDTNKFGCNKVLEEIPHILLPIKDVFDNGLEVCMAIVNINSKKQKVELKTKNCTEDDNIKYNILYASRFNEKNLEIYKEKVLKYSPVHFIEGACKPNNETIVLVGASEEIMDENDDEYGKTWEELRDHYKDLNTKIVVCKTSFKKIIEMNVIPWGCILLDPRDHVAEKIDIRNDIIYFVCSMCHPTTWDKLMDGGCKIIGYHALVGAQEVPTIEQNYGKSICISGGTSSIMRGIGLFYYLGFRKFIFYGMTSSYKKRKDKPHGRSVKDFIEVEVHGRKFLTDPEMIAQSQDAEIAIKMFPNCKLEFKGDGMLNHAVNILREIEKERAGDDGFIDLRIGQFVHPFRSKDREMEYIGIDNAIKALEDRKQFLSKFVFLPHYKDKVDI